jgi:hypothetical protein
MCPSIDVMSERVSDWPDPWGVQIKVLKGIPIQEKVRICFPNPGTFEFAVEVILCIASIPNVVVRDNLHCVWLLQGLATSLEGGCKQQSMAAGMMFSRSFQRDDVCGVQVLLDR